MINLKEKPFYLDDEQINKVNELVSSMTIEEKIGQIFCPVGIATDVEAIKEFVEKYKPGGMMYRPMEATVIKEIYSTLQEISKIPMLLAANLESGGIGICNEGTYFSRQMGIAATNNEENAYRLGTICGKEANAVHCNWSFAPILDIDFNPFNPITNVRTYGSDIDRITKMVRAQIKGLNENDVIPCIKHFPGDGVDFRDQHLVTSVNNLSIEKWDDTFGKIYKTFIDEGAQSLMVGHILLPNYIRKFNSDVKDSDMLPASISKEILTDLLRNQLNFNGLVVTDATPMVGYNTVMKRREALPLTIENGCDMILFNRNIDEDYRYIQEGIEAGLLSMERLDEAVLRIIATKMANSLFDKEKRVNDISVIGCKEHKDWTKQCAKEAITLVKDRENILPISPKKFKKIRLFNLKDRTSGGFNEKSSTIDFKVELQKLGFEVDEFNYEELNMYELFEAGVDYHKEKADLIIYLADFDTASNNTVRRIDWVKLVAGDAPWLVEEIPTIFISLVNPYHLIDVPYIKTYINCYSPIKEVMEALLGKLTGNDEFVGISPVDEYCGLWDAKR